MAKTESSQKPFRILEMYLRLLDGEVLTRPEEAARYGIDIRSVQRDINALRLFLSGQTIEGFSQTVAYSRKAGGYILRGNKKDLTREEALALCKILLESRAFSKKEMENIVDKIIRSAVARREIVAAQRLVDNEKRYYEELSCCDSHLLDKIWSIGDAVSRQNMLKIRYTKKGGEKVERVVKPLSIMFSEFYFYLIGDIVQFDEDGAPFSRYGFPAVFRVDRIENFEEGDSFRVLVEKLYREGEYKGYGKVLAAAFTNRGKTFEAFLFRDGSGREGHFYNAAGESLRKTLLQAPLPITRVTSRFTNSRKHPILGYSRPHLGVDYGAPTGTPVMAVGSGKVLKAGRAGGFGNQIIVRHHQNLESMYNHLSGYARGIRSGVSVRQGQVIGYVGSTGLSTGPHLDFRIKQNGKFIDPTKAVNPRAPGVSRRKAKEFAAVVAEYRAYMSGAKELSAYKTDEELEEHDSEGQ